jgi:hypothetical protein
MKSGMPMQYISDKRKALGMCGNIAIDLYEAISEKVMDFVIVSMLTPLEPLAASFSASISRSTRKKGEAPGKEDRKNNMSGFVGL